MSKAIDEGNKLIFLFMGAKEMSSTTTPQGVKTILSAQLGNIYARYFSTDLKYHSSWDWLHPVWRKWNSLGLVLNTYDEWSEKIANAMMYEDTPHEAAKYLAQAIQWLNTQKQTQ